jgi:hypothetical protein
VYICENSTRILIESDLGIGVGLLETLLLYQWVSNMFV